MTESGDKDRSMISTLAPDFAAALPDGGRLAGLDVSGT